MLSDAIRCSQMPSDAVSYSQLLSAALSYFQLLSAAQNLLIFHLTQFGEVLLVNKGFGFILDYFRAILCSKIEFCMGEPSITSNFIIPKSLDMSFDTFWLSQVGQYVFQWHIWLFRAGLCSKIGFLVFSHESTVYYDQLQKTLTLQFDNLHHLVH